MLLYQPHVPVMYKRKAEKNLELFFVFPVWIRIVIFSLLTTEVKLSINPLSPSAMPETCCSFLSFKQGENICDPLSAN